MQPQRYPTTKSQVGLISTLFTGVTLLWFSPLLEKNSLILVDLDTFLTKFNNTFGNTNRVQTIITKLRSLQQKSCIALTYTTEFRLLTNDVDWDDNALISAFQWGLRDDIRDLLLNLLDPTSLSKAITQAVRCDNLLFEQR